MLERLKSDISILIAHSLTSAISHEKITSADIVGRSTVDMAKHAGTRPTSTGDNDTALVCQTIKKLGTEMLCEMPQG